MFTHLRVAQLPEDEERIIQLDETDESNPNFTRPEQSYIRRQKQKLDIPRWDADPLDWEEYYWKKHQNERLDEGEGLERRLGYIGIQRSISAFWQKVRISFCKRAARPSDDIEEEPVVRSIQKLRIDERWDQGPVKLFTSIVPMENDIVSDQPVLELTTTANAPSTPNIATRTNRTVKAMIGREAERVRSDYHDRPYSLAIKLTTDKFSNLTMQEKATTAAPALKISKTKFKSNVIKCPTDVKLSEPKMQAGFINNIDQSTKPMVSIPSMTTSVVPLPVSVDYIRPLDSVFRERPSKIALHSVILDKDPYKDPHEKATLNKPLARVRGIPRPDIDALVTPVVERQICVQGEFVSVQVRKKKLINATAGERSVSQSPERNGYFQHRQEESKTNEQTIIKEEQGVAQTNQERSIRRIVRIKGSNQGSPSKASDSMTAGSS